MLHDAGSSNASPVWKILPTFIVRQPCWRKNCGRKTASVRSWPRRRDVVDDARRVGAVAAQERGPRRVADGVLAVGAIEPDSPPASRSMFGGVSLSRLP